MSQTFYAAVSKSATVLRQLAAKYEDVVVKDPDFTSKLESTLKVASYIIPGQLGNSWEFGELAYCISNLYSLGNDYIIARKCPASCDISRCPQVQQRLLWFLSLLDCVEVALEVLTQRYLGEPCKWGAVIVMQLIRMVLRAVLVFQFRTSVLCTPPVSPPDRKLAQDISTRQVPEGEDQSKLAWTAPRTGRVIRSFHTDDSIPYSELQHHVATPPALHSFPQGMSRTRGQRSSVKQKVAEVLYLARPLVHIVSMMVFSQKSWKPWLVSVVMDVCSLQLLGGPTRYRGRKEKGEVNRRRCLLLLYLLRSPFYDDYLKSAILDFLKSASGKIPLVHYITDAVVGYLPLWQQTYSYNWTT